jgi:hypothetical protein
MVLRLGFMAVLKRRSSGSSCGGLCFRRITVLSLGLLSFEIELGGVSFLALKPVLLYYNQILTNRFYRCPQPTYSWEQY